jgi:hypothetical protein
MGGEKQVVAPLGEAPEDGHLLRYPVPHGGVGAPVQGADVEGPAVQLVEDVLLPPGPQGVEGGLPGGKAGQGVVALGLPLALICAFPPQAPWTQERTSSRRTS